MQQDNDIFKALADPSRRTLLDLLFEADGRTLSELCAHLDLSRFGVMKHLNILEEAGLLTTRRSGREKYHYLNPVPITQIHDRWVSKFAKPWTRSLNDLKYELESETVKKEHVYQIWIRTEPHRLWQALTDPEMTRKFLYRSRVISSWNIGDDIAFIDDNGQTTATGHIVACDPPRLLAYTWRLLAVPETSGDGFSRITYQIERSKESPDVCVLTVTHDRFDDAPNTYHYVRNGWPAVLSNMKSLLETGEPLL